LPEPSKRFATTGEDFPPMVTGGMKGISIGLGMLKEKGIWKTVGYVRWIGTGIG
jgi:hypothetical protein